MALPATRVDLTAMADADPAGPVPAWARCIAGLGVGLIAPAPAAPAGRIAAPATPAPWRSKLRRVVRLPCRAASMLSSRLAAAELFQLQHGDKLCCQPQPSGRKRIR